MTDPERLAMIARHEARTAFQAAQDAALTPASGAPAEQVTDDWKPIILYLQEGSDVGYRQEAESEGGQRIN